MFNTLTHTPVLNKVCVIKCALTHTRLITASAKHPCHKSALSFIFPLTEPIGERNITIVFKSLVHRERARERERERARESERERERARESERERGREREREREE